MCPGIHEDQGWVIPVSSILANVNLKVKRMELLHIVIGVYWISTFQSWHGLSNYIDNTGSVIR